jgi:hypothetical protein
MKMTAAVLAIALGLGITSWARADVIPFSVATTTPFNGSQTLALPQFDPALGSLTDITINVAGTLHSTWVCTNRSSTTAYARIMEQQDFAITLGTQVLLSATQHSHDEYYANWAFAVPGTPNYDPNEPAFEDGWRTSAISCPTNTPITHAIWNQSVSSNNIAIPTTDFSAFIGSGYVNLTATEFDQLMYSMSGGNFTGGLVNTADAQATVTYTFIPVPEPASLAVVALGICGMLIRRRRS